MKILLITTLTTAFLSFNSFADNTTDIKSVADLMTKEGQHQLNIQLTSNSKATTREYLKTFALTIASENPVLVTKIVNKNISQTKNTIQVTD